MSKLTKVGKFLKKLRVDNDELLMDMSLKLGVTPSHISAIEIGKIKLSDELRDKIVRVYGLDEHSDREVKEKNEINTENK